MTMCSTHTSTEAAPKHTVCRTCLLRMRLAYVRRAKPLTRCICLRCGRRGSRPWKESRRCWACRRTLLRNPEAEVRA